MKVQRLVKQLKVGDLVVRTYGEGQRPTAIIVRLYGGKEFKHIGCYSDAHTDVIWTGSDKITKFETKFLEVISASR